MERKLVDFNYCKLAYDAFNHEKGTRKRNDIAIKEFDDNSKVATIYFDDKEFYAEFPYDSMLINEMSSKTWTIDTKDGSFVKSGADKLNLNSIIYRYTGSGYKLKEKIYEEIDEKSKSLKRKEFIKKYPDANSKEPLN